MRKAKVTTVEELFKKICTYTEPGWEGDGPSLYEIIEKLKSDFKVEFDLENHSNIADIVYVDWLNQSLIEGYICINNTWMYIGWAGGDWECPVYFVLYLDPKNKLRAYIPTKGNPYNRKNMQALGYDDNDGEYDDDPNFHEMMEDIKARIEVVA